VSETLAYCTTPVLGGPGYLSGLFPNGLEPTCSNAIGSMHLGKSLICCVMLLKRGLTLVEFIQMSYILLHPYCYCKLKQSEIIMALKI
jgi:hypothetical protein